LTFALQDDAAVPSEGGPWALVTTDTIYGSFNNKIEEKPQFQVFKLLNNPIGCNRHVKTQIKRFKNASIGIMHG
jgi:hypothetical protein